MKKLATLLVFVWILFAASHVISVQAQQTADAVGLTGTIKNPDGSLFNGKINLRLTSGTVKNICTTPYSMVPQSGSGVVYNIVNGVIVNGAAASFITQDCMSPRAAYYMTLSDTTGKTLATDNWYFRQQAQVSGSRLQDVGTLVDVLLNMPQVVSQPVQAKAPVKAPEVNKLPSFANTVKGESFVPLQHEEGTQAYIAGQRLGAGAGPVTVALQQALVANPVGNQTIVQPAGTNLIVNSAVCTGTCTGFGGGSGGGSVTSVGVGGATDIFSYSNTPVTASGTLTITANPQAAHAFWAGPATGSSSGAPSFRALVSADIPNNSALSGGINILTTAGDLLYENNTPTNARLAAGSSTQVLHSGSTPTWSSVNLASDVTGIIPASNVNTGSLANTSVLYNTYYQGTYASGTTYSIGEIVEYSNNSYTSLVNANVGHEPDTSPGDWASIGGSGTAALASFAANGVSGINTCHVFPSQIGTGPGQYSDAFALINSCSAQLPSRGGKIDATAFGPNDYNVATQLTALNNANQTVMLYLDTNTRFIINTAFSGTLSNSPAFCAVPIGVSGSSFGGSGIIVLGHSNLQGSTFWVGNNARVWDVVCDGDFTGNIESIVIDGIGINGSGVAGTALGPSGPGAVIGGALLHIAGIFGPTLIANSSTVSCNAQCVELDAGTTGSGGSGLGNVMFYNDTWTSDGVSGTATYPGSVFQTDTLSSIGAIGNVLFVGGIIQDNGPHNPLFVMHGRGTIQTSVITFVNTYFETAPATPSVYETNVDPIQLYDVSQFYADSLRVGGDMNPTTQPNLIDIGSDVSPIPHASSFGIEIHQLAATSLYTNLINNQVDGTTEQGYKPSGPGGIALLPYYYSGGQVLPQNRTTNNPPPTTCVPGGTWTNSSGDYSQNSVFLNCQGVPTSIVSGVPQGHYYPFGQAPMPTWNAQVASGGNQTANATVLTVANFAGYGSNGYLPQKGCVFVDTEIECFDGYANGQLLNLVRGARGTTATTHIAGAQVTSIANFLSAPSDVVQDILLNNGALLVGVGAPQIAAATPYISVAGTQHSMCDYTTTPATCQMIGAGTPTGCGTTYGIGSTYGNEQGAANQVFWQCSPPGTTYASGGTGPATNTNGISANFENTMYFTTGSNPGGYTVPSISVYLGTGGTTGDLIDVGITTAPTALTQGTTPLCHVTYTEPVNQPVGYQPIQLSGCGTLTPNTSYWVFMITNDGGILIGQNNCGGSCTGGAGSSSYGALYLGTTYGTYPFGSSTLNGPVTYQRNLYANLIGVSDEWVSIGAYSANPGGTGGGSGGSVTSVAMTAPSVFSVGGSPITGSGTLAITFAGGQTAKEFLATPNGTTGAVGLRTIVSSDLPVGTSSVPGALQCGSGTTCAAGVISVAGGGGGGSLGTALGDILTANSSGNAVDQYIYLGSAASSTTSNLGIQPAVTNANSNNGAFVIMPGVGRTAFTNSGYVRGIDLRTDVLAYPYNVTEAGAQCDAGSYYGTFTSGSTNFTLSGTSLTSAYVGRYLVAVGLVSGVPTQFESQIATITGSLTGTVTTSFPFTQSSLAEVNIGHDDTSVIQGVLNTHNNVALPSGTCMVHTLVIKGQNIQGVAGQNGSALLGMPGEDIMQAPDPSLTTGISQGGSHWKDIEFLVDGRIDATSPWKMVNDSGTTNETANYRPIQTYGPNSSNPMGPGWFNGGYNGVASITASSAVICIPTGVTVPTVGHSIIFPYLTTLFTTTISSTAGSCSGGATPRTLASTLPTGSTNTQAEWFAGPTVGLQTISTAIGSGSCPTSITLNNPIIPEPGYESNVGPFGLVKIDGEQFTYFGRNNAGVYGGATTPWTLYNIQCAQNGTSRAAHSNGAAIVPLNQYQPTYPWPVTPTINSGNTTPATNAGFYPAYNVGNAAISCPIVNGQNPSTGSTGCWAANAVLENLFFYPWPNDISNNWQGVNHTAAFYFAQPSYAATFRNWQILYLFYGLANGVPSIENGGWATAQPTADGTNWENMSIWAANPVTLAAGGQNNVSNFNMYSNEQSTTPSTSLGADTCFVIGRGWNDRTGGVEQLQGATKYDNIYCEPEQATIGASPVHTGAMTQWVWDMNNSIVTDLHMGGGGEVSIGGSVNQFNAGNFNNNPGGPIIITGNHNVFNFIPGAGYENKSNVYGVGALLNWSYENNLISQTSNADGTSTGPFGNAAGGTRDIIPGQTNETFNTGNTTAPYTSSNGGFIPADEFNTSRVWEPNPPTIGWTYDTTSPTTHAYIGCPVGTATNFTYCYTKLFNQQGIGIGPDQRLAAGKYMMYLSVKDQTQASNSWNFWLQTCAGIQYSWAVPLSTTWSVFSALVDLSAAGTCTPLGQLGLYMNNASVADNVLIGYIDFAPVPQNFTAQQITISGMSTNVGSCVLVGTNGLLTAGSCSGSGGSGLTSVGLSMPADFSISGSPLTSNGTLTVSYASETQNTFFAGPNGSNGIPSFRTIQSADLPVGTSSVPGALQCGSGTTCAAGVLTVTGGGGTTTNALTMNNSGSGASSGTTFNGSAAETISYNTIGAAPSASPTFTGTVTIPALTLSGITGSTQCLHVNSSGVVSGAGADCGSGGSGLTSVGLTMPTGFTVGSSPLTSNGTLGVTFTTGQTANLFFATPNGTTGAVSLRAIVAADIPTLNQSTTGNASTATTATNLSGTGVDYAPYQSASGTTSYITAPTTNADTFVYAWKPTGSAVAPTAVNLGALPANLPTSSIVDTTTTQTLTGKTLDGVTPTTMGYLDATSSIQTQLNGKAATNANTTGTAGNGVAVYTLSGATPTAVVSSTSIPAVDENFLPLTANVTSFPLLASSAVANGEILRITVQQGVSTAYTLPTGTANSPFTAGSGTTLINAVPTGCPTIGTTTGSVTPSEIFYTLQYHSALTEWEILGCNTTVAQTGLIDAPPIEATGTFGGTAVNTPIQSISPAHSGHIVNLVIVNTNASSNCTTAPTFNVFDGTSNTGTAKIGITTAQTKGNATSQSESLAFNAGDVIGIYISTAGATCTVPVWSVSAMVTEP